MYDTPKEKENLLSSFLSPSYLLYFLSPTKICSPYVCFVTNYFKRLVLSSTSQPTLATNSHTRTLKYSVRPLHATLEKYVWDFGAISDQTEMESILLLLWVFLLFYIYLYIYLYKVNLIQFNSIQFNSIQFNSIQFNSIQFN
jgi:beta-lactamase regulating signal transducer with metallopeptidase domain